MTSFQRLGLYQSLYSLQWWLTQWSLPSSTTMMAEICLYIVISLIVLCYYCKNQIIVKDCWSLMNFEWKPSVETVLLCISTFSGLSHSLTHSLTHHRNRVCLAPQEGESPSLPKEEEQPEGWNYLNYSKFKINNEMYSIEVSKLTEKKNEPSDALSPPSLCDVPHWPKVETIKQSLFWGSYNKLQEELWQAWNLSQK